MRAGRQAIARAAEEFEEFPRRRDRRDRLGENDERRAVAHQEADRGAWQLKSTTWYRALAKRMEYF